MAEKMVRWAQIINSLCRQEMTVYDLMERFEMSDRTIYRDIRDLRKAGYPIRQRETGGGYYINDRQFGFRMLFLSDDEASALFQCIEAFGQDGFPLSDELKAAKDKLASCMPQERLQAVKERMQVTDIHLPEPYQLSAHTFDLLTEAAAAKRQLCVRYYAPTSSKETMVRTINPYGLIYKNNVWYLIAYCHKRQDVRVFRADRVTDIQVMADTFSIPQDFSLETFFDKSWSIEQGPEVVVKLRFLPEVARDIKRAKYHQSQELSDLPDGSVLFAVKVRGLWEISRWILGFGPTVEVLEPEELRHDIIQMVARTNELYKKV